MLQLLDVFWLELSIACVVVLIVVVVVYTTVNTFLE